MYVGSHNIVLKENDSVLYWRVWKEAIKDKNIPKEHVFFFEAFGKGVQDLHYNTLPKIKVFNIMVKGEYLNLNRVKEICSEVGLECVDFHEIIFESVEQLQTIADSPSEVWDGLREGIVCVSAETPSKMAKVLNFEYLARKKGTERH